MYFSILSVHHQKIPFFWFSFSTVFCQYMLYKKWFCSQQSLGNNTAYNHTSKACNLEGKKIWGTSQVPLPIIKHFSCNSVILTFKLHHYTPINFTNEHKVTRRNVFQRIFCISNIKKAFLEAYSPSKYIIIP